MNGTADRMSSAHDVHCFLKSDWRRPCDLKQKKRSENKQQHISEEGRYDWHGTSRRHASPTFNKKCSGVNSLVSTPSMLSTSLCCVLPQTNTLSYSRVN